MNLATDCKLLFESAPGLFLVLLPDLTIQAMTDDYAAATMTTREQILGRNLFDVFPDNPEDQNADGVSNLRASLNSVLKNKATHTMAIQKYDIRRPDGTFEERYWSPVNKPVFKDGSIAYIIHRVEDVTNFVRLQKEVDAKKKVTDELQARSLEMELEIFNRSQELKKLNATLEQTVEERTEQLKNSYKDIADYKLALDASSIISITDADGIILQVNDNFCKISKYSSLEIIGKDHSMFNSGYHSNAFMQDLRDTIANGVIWMGEIRNVAKDGTYHWLYTTIVPFLDHQGKPYKYLAIRSDITDRKNAYEALRASEVRYRNLYENSLVALFTTDLTTSRIVQVNEIGVRLLGYSSKAEVVNILNGVDFYVRPEERNKTVEALLRDGVITNSLLEMRRKDGTHFWVNSFVKLNDDKTLAQTALVDVTGQVQAYEALRLSEAKYRGIYDNTVVAMFTAEMDTRKIIDTNDVGWQLLGYTSKQEFIDFYDPKVHLPDLSVRDQNIAVLLEKGQMNNGIQRMQKLDGTCIWVKVFSKLDKTNFTAQTVLIDITPQISAYEQLKKSEENYRNLFENSLVAVFIADVVTQMPIDVNETAALLMGYTSKADLLENYSHNLHFGDPADVEKLYHEIVETGYITNRELKLKKRDGTNFWAMASITLNSDKTQAHCVITDITPQIHNQEILEARVKERTLELTESLNRELLMNELKSRFIATASHEFRTPLTTILFSTNLLETYISKNEPDKCTKHLNRIKSIINDLTQILTDFLSLEKLESGNVTTVTGPVDIKELSTATLEEVAHTFTNGTNIIYGHEGNSMVIVDRNILHNILLNLLSNACKYSKPGAPINLATTNRAGNLVIKVADQGIGIPAADQPHIFTHFFRATNVNTIQGTGLGLNIVKKYVELLSGTIGFTSEESIGTTFTVEIPVLIN